MGEQKRGEWRRMREKWEGDEEREERRDEGGQKKRDGYVMGERRRWRRTSIRHVMTCMITMVTNDNSDAI